MENKCLLTSRQQIILQCLNGLSVNRKRRCTEEQGGEKLPLKHNSLQIEKLPETSDAETWAKFNDRLNELANQGYNVLRATETYIILRRTTNAIRREE